MPTERVQHEAPNADTDSHARFDMTLRSYILFGLGLYVALTAGILVATSGREKLLAAAIALAIVGPMWMIDRPRWVRQHLDDRPQVEVGKMKPKTLLIIMAVGLCSTAWSVTRYYQRAEWMRVVVSSLVTLWFLYMMYLAKQRWSKLKQSEDGSRVA